MKNSNLQDIDKAYVSEHDKFLHQWDLNHKPTASQIAEIEKYNKIFKLRDTAQEH